MRSHFALQFSSGAQSVRTMAYAAIAGVVETANSRYDQITTILLVVIIFFCRNLHTNLKRIRCLLSPQLWCLSRDHNTTISDFATSRKKSKNEQNNLKLIECPTAF